MRIFILFLVIFCSFNAALAKKEPPHFAGTPFPIDEEFVTDFVEYDVKEAKVLEKQQKVQDKIDKKRAKLEEKKAALVKKRNASIENCERSQVYIEKLRSSKENL